MSLLDPREKTISLKVVYYGPGLGGKTTSLKHIHQVIDPEGKIKLVSLDTDEDRTLFFDFLPIELGLVGRFKVKIQGFTVPGQVKYNMTRRYVLTGADGIVFVADSDPARLVENVESLINLGDNLRAHGLNVNNIPLVFEYNKQDLNNAISPTELEEKLNFRKVPSLATIATKGDGVFEAFIAVSKLMVSRVIKTYNLKEEQAEEERILMEVESRLISLKEPGGVQVAPIPNQTSPPALAERHETAEPGYGDVPERSETLEMTGASGTATGSPFSGDPTSKEAEDFFGSFRSGESGVQESCPPKASEVVNAGIHGNPEGAEVRKTPAHIQHSQVSGSSSRTAPKKVVQNIVSPHTHDRSEVKDVVERHGETISSSQSKPDRFARSPIPHHENYPVVENRAHPNLKNLLRSLLEIGRGMASGASLEKSATAILSAACQAFEAVGGSMLAIDDAGSSLRPMFLNGFRNDPLLLSQKDGGRRIIQLVESGGDQLDRKSVV